MFLEQITIMVSLVDFGKISMKPSKIFNDSGKNVLTYGLSDTGKFSKILSCNMVTFHKICLKVQKLGVPAEFLKLNFDYIEENFHAGF